MRVLLKSPYSSFTGYGNDGFSLARALMEWGCDVLVQPTHVDVPIPRDILHLFSKPLEPPFDLTINHWSPDGLELIPQARHCTRAAIAWTMWEFTSLAPHCKGRSSLARRLKMFDLFLGYSQLTMDAMAPWLPPEKKVARAILQGGVDAKEWPYIERDWYGDRFQFIMHGALGPRKCPFTVIQAFTELRAEQPQFAEHARLALHSNMPGMLHNGMNEVFANQNIRVWVDNFDKQKLRDFYAAGHCYLLPSRGEGKNLPALEFLCTGGAVAVTNWSGHLNWLNPDYAYPLDYTLGPTFPRHPEGAQDAKVSVEEVKRVMWHVFTHRAEAKQKAELGSRLIPQLCDWSVVLEGLFNRIRDHCPHNGELLWGMAQEARMRQREKHTHRPSDLAGVR